MMRLGLIFLWSLVVGPMSVKTQGIGNCLNTLITDFQTGRDPCIAFNDYVKCSALDRSLDIVLVTDRDKQNFQNEINALIAQMGVNCYIDVRPILIEVAELRRNGVTLATRAPTSYESAITAGDCLNTLTRSLETAGRVTCNDFTLVTKCTIRVEGYYKNPQKELLDLLRRNMETVARNAGLTCFIDVDSLAEQLRREHGVPLFSTTMMTTSTPSAADAIAKCMHFASDGISCTAAVNYMKCLVNEWKLDHTSLTDQEINNFQDNINRDMKIRGFNCNIDFRTIIKEAIEERENRNGNSAAQNSVHRDSQLFLFVIPALAVFLSKLWTFDN